MLKVDDRTAFDWGMKSSINQHSWRLVLRNGNRSSQWKAERFIASPGGQQIGPAAALLFAVRRVIEWLLCFYLLASCLQIRSIHRLDHGQEKLRPWRRLSSVAARSNLTHEPTKSQLHNFKKIKFFRNASQRIKMNRVQQQSSEKWFTCHVGRLCAKHVEVDPLHFISRWTGKSSR
jgi:hypothetical protein